MYLVMYSFFQYNTSVQFYHRHICYILFDQALLIECFLGLIVLHHLKTNIMLYNIELKKLKIIKNFEFNLNK